MGLKVSLFFFFKLGKMILKRCGGARGHFLRLQPVDSDIQYNSHNANRTLTTCIVLFQYLRI